MPKQVNRPYLSQLSSGNIVGLGVYIDPDGTVFQDTVHGPVKVDVKAPIILNSKEEN